MKKLLLLFIFIGQISMADEGMWLPQLLKRLNESELQKAGSKLTPEEIFSINSSSLKDCIVNINGCTSEIISANGLLLTNHHCAYGGIQSVSTVEKNYLEKGFWANSFNAELPLKGMTAAILHKIEEVTDKVLSGVSDTTSENRRKNIVEANIKSIQKEFAQGTKYKATVREMFGGNVYYVFVTTVYKDVRLVGCPPSIIGKFGGDTDNWMWPRHTGDFSLIRIYTSPSGDPAEYSKDNIPYKAKKFLPISLKGVKENDFSLIMGYPGRTNRYATSDQIKMIMEKENPAKIKLQGQILESWKTYMDKDPKIKIQYASKYASKSNGHKYAIGQNEGLKKLNVISDKAAIEKVYTNWVFADSARKKSYGYVLTEITKAVNEYSEINYRIQYLNIAGKSSELVNFAFGLKNYVDELNNKNFNKLMVDSLKEKLLEKADEFYKNYHFENDINCFENLLKIYVSDIPAEFIPDVVKDAAKLSEKNKLKESILKNSKLTELDAAKILIQNQNAKEIENDWFYKYAIQLNNFADNNLIPYQKKYNNIVDANKRLYMKSMIECFSEKKFYPDANATLRVSYGTIKDYKAKDAVNYHWQTTGKGILEKYKEGDPEFDVPPKLLSLLKAKEFGRYGENGNLPVAFLTDNDITGGNSGSPVLNSQGQLIGVAYDGNWEAMTGDLVYDPLLKRTIVCDIRYVLFIIEKYANAQNIMSELRLID